MFFGGRSDRREPLISPSASRTSWPPEEPAEIVRDEPTPLAREVTGTSQGSPRCLPGALYHAQNLNPCRENIAPGEESTWQWGIEKPQGVKMLSPEAHLQLSLACCRTQLANERTYLAWVRTCCSLLVLGIAVDKIADRGTEITALLFISCAVCAAWYSQSRYRLIKRELRRAYPNEIVTPATTRWFMGMFMMSVFICVVIYSNDLFAQFSGISVLPNKHSGNQTDIIDAQSAGASAIASFFI